MEFQYNPINEHVFVRVVVQVNGKVDIQDWEILIADSSDDKYYGRAFSISENAEITWGLLRNEELCPREEMENKIKEYINKQSL